MKKYWFKMCLKNLDFRMDANHVHLVINKIASFKFNLMNIIIGPFYQYL